MRKIAGTALILFAFAAFAAAQVPTSGNVYFGYSYLNTNLSKIDRVGTNGWDTSVEGHVFPFVGMVADFSSHYGSENFPGAACGITCVPTAFSVNVSEQNYLFGPRVSFSAGKFRPFAEALIGAAHVNANTAGSDTSFATAIGGGLDYRLIRVLAWRFQGDYLQTRFFGTTQNNVRITTGIVVRF